MLFADNAAKLAPFSITTNLDAELGTPESVPVSGSPASPSRRRKLAAEVFPPSEVAVWWVRRFYLRLDATETDEEKKALKDRAKGSVRVVLEQVTEKVQRAEVPIRIP